MPSYLNFETTKNFRDSLINRTLKNDNGPQTFNGENYSYNGLSNMSNNDPGDVVVNDVMTREERLKFLSNLNMYKPIDEFSGLDRTFSVLNKNKGLKLYPYFPTNLPDYNLIGILTSDINKNESELSKFSQSLIKRQIGNLNGPVFDRLNNNIYKSINGKLRFIDALKGNTSTAINLLTGRENLIERDFSITTSDNIIGKGVDIIETLSGTNIPLSRIPGDYLTNPLNPTLNNRKVSQNEIGKTLQDLSGNIGSIIGIKRKNVSTYKPSDLFIEHMGNGQKQLLFNNLSYSRYAPNYTTTARSQNTSKIFNFVDNVSQEVKNILGVEAPNGVSYIGDDRGNDVKNVLIEPNDYYQRPVYSLYYLSLMFDEVGTKLFNKDKNLTENGTIAGSLTWISKKNNNKLGTNNKQYNKTSSSFEDTLSNKFNFRDDSILGITQEILDSIPNNGATKYSHVGNVIDQTTRLYREGDNKLSKGSAIKYIDKNNVETGVEFCRVWTKDRPYYYYSDTMKRNSNIRKFDSSVLGGKSRVWNLNIAPTSNGKNNFDNSTNIEENYKFGGGFYAKKYMFSIENLAWKTSNIDGFKVSDLPVTERGPNGGRIMWFPPYDLKMSETNNARWDENIFLGRPEPIYTYQNTTRNVNLSFKVIVDHPSVLNLIINEKFKNMSDEESDNYINAFFAGCEDVDLYDLVRKYTTLTPDEVTLIKDYLNEKNVEPSIINEYKYTLLPQNTEKVNNTISDNTDTIVNKNFKFYFDNDIPNKLNINDISSNETYEELFNNYKKKQQGNLFTLKTDLLDILTGETSTNIYAKQDRLTIFNSEFPLKGHESNLVTTINSLISQQTGMTNNGFVDLTNQYNTYTNSINELKNDLDEFKINEVLINIDGSSSSVGELNYNFYLSLRRINSIVKDIFNKLSKNGNQPKIKWISNSDVSNYEDNITPLLSIGEYNLREFGYNQDTILKINIQGKGEKNSNVTNVDCAKEIKTKKGLKKTLPLSFYCRQSNISFRYTKSLLTNPINKIETNDNTKSINNNIEENTISVNNNVNNNTKKPNINILQKILTKTLSESYYFKVLEESDPVVFKSLKDKLKYFHPSFHSMTPEGLNSRLTFLLQCVRPGDTIPIKNISDNLDIVRNTSFGPPPICILRIGDFYNTKTIIRDVNITYDDSTWDLNPEGIGVQPMIANVNLSLSLIGGHGLDNPVDILQNALTSNFFANTEMYDERSKITSKINGSEYTKFTEEFLNSLQNAPQNKLLTNDNDVNQNTYINNTFIGDGTNPITYTNIINNLYTEVNNYYESLKTTYNIISYDYGNDLISLLFSDQYRIINQYNFNNKTLKFIGNYPKNKNLQYYILTFLNKLNSKIDTHDIKSVFGFENINLVPNGEQILKNLLKTYLGNKLDLLINDKNIIKLIEIRNKIIVLLDKLNFIIKYEHDVTISNNETKQITLVNFNVNDFYGIFSNIIDFIESKNNFIEEKIDSDINFNNINITDSIFENFLKRIINSDVFLREMSLKITNNVIEQEKVYQKLIKSIKNNENIKKSLKTPTNNNTNIEFNTQDLLKVTDVDEINEILSLFNKNEYIQNNLNYLRDGKTIF